MSALLIPFPASCRARTAEAQKRISRAFKRITDAGTAETPEQRWARAVEVTGAIDAAKSKRVPPSTTPASAQPVGGLNLETEMEALAQIIADRARPGARKEGGSVRPPRSDLEGEMGVLAVRIGARSKQIIASRTSDSPRGRPLEREELPSHWPENLKQHYVHCTYDGFRSHDEMFPYCEELAAISGAIPGETEEQRNARLARAAIARLKPKREK